VPAVSQFLTWVKKANPSWTPDLYTLFGWTSAALFVQALQAAGPHPTRGAVLAPAEKVQPASTPTGSSPRTTRPRSCHPPVT